MASCWESSRFWLDGNKLRSGEINAEGSNMSGAIAQDFVQVGGYPRRRLTTRLTSDDVILHKQSVAMGMLFEGFGPS